MLKITLVAKLNRYYTDNSEGSNYDLCRSLVLTLGEEYKYP